METENNIWAVYYQELDPEKRLAILNEYADPENPTDVFRKKLFSERYEDPKNPKRRVDTWLWKCVYLPGIYKRRRIFVKPLRHEVEQTLKELHLTELEEMSAEQREALYLEYRNAARRYLTTCKGDRYGSSLFGLKKAEEDDQKVLAAEDIWNASLGIARAVGLEEQMKLWCDALYEELLVYDPRAQKRYEELSAKSSQG